MADPVRIPRPHHDNWDFGVTYAKKFPPYVYSDNGMGCLIHKVSQVSIHWWDYSYYWLIKRTIPVLIAETVCGMHKRIESGRMKSALCAVPKPEAVLCGRCHGQSPNFPRKDNRSREARREARRKLGCIAIEEESNG